MVVFENILPLTLFMRCHTLLYLQSFKLLWFIPVSFDLSVSRYIAGSELMFWYWGITMFQPEFSQGLGPTAHPCLLWYRGGMYGTPQSPSHMSNLWRNGIVSSSFVIATWKWDAIAFLQHFEVQGLCGTHCTTPPPDIVEDGWVQTKPLGHCQWHNHFCHITPYPCAPTDTLGDSNSTQEFENVWARI